MVYGEPSESNRSVIGFDTLTLPGQGASIDLAIDSGRMTATMPLKVRQHEGPDPSLVLRLAIYRPGWPSSSPEQRRRALYAVANVVFRAQDLILAALGPETLSTMNVWIEDAGAANGTEAASAPVPLYGVRPGPSGLSLWPPLETRRSLTVGGRIWSLHFRGHPAHADPLVWILPLAVFAAGLAITTLLVGLLASLKQTGQRARQMALTMTEQLQQNESRLQAIAQAVPDLLFVLDEEGRYIEVHGGQDELLASPKPTLLGHTLQEMLPPEVAQACMISLVRALASHQLQTVSYALNTPAGPISFEARLFEMATRVNGKRCVVVVARDITERSRVEENLRVTQKLESLGVLAGGIAHDFNNLLTAILGNLNLAQGQLQTEAKAGPYLHRVETAVLRAAELAHQMLAYSGRGTFTVASLDLNQVVNEMTELLSVSISKKATLHFELSPGLAPILADAAQIQQVVMNLVTNASEALEDRGGTIAIRTCLRLLDQAYLERNLPTQALEPGPYIALTVADSGCGMDPETLARIFDPFFTTKSTGRGLGLSAMLGILRGHRAGIRIDSEAGAGSTFQVLFPAAPAAPQSGLAQSPGSVACPLLAGTVLVVDDEPLIRTTISNLLETMGMQVIQAGDGLEALERHAEHGRRIDLVLMDITMPRMDGNQAFLALRQRDPELPVILCSGFTILEMAPPPPGTRPATFMQKPYRIGDLKQALQCALQERPLADKEPV